MRGFIYVLFIDEDRELRIVTVKRLMTRERTGQRREKMYIKGRELIFYYGRRENVREDKDLTMYSGHTFN